MNPEAWSSESDQVRLKRKASGHAASADGGRGERALAADGWPGGMWISTLYSIRFALLLMLGSPRIAEQGRMLP